MLERDLTKNTLDEERYLGQGLGQGPGDSIERLSRGSTDGRNPGDSASLGIGYGLGQDLTSSQDHGLGLNDFPPQGKPATVVVSSKSIYGSIGVGSVIKFVRIISILWKFSRE